MTQDIRGVLKLALEALENSVDLVVEDAYNAEQLYGNYPTRQGKVGGLKILADQHKEAITAIKEVLAQPRQKPYAWELDGELYKTQQFHLRGGPYANQIPLYTSPPQPEQEPVALETLLKWDDDIDPIGEVVGFIEGSPYIMVKVHKGKQVSLDDDLYATPPQRTEQDGQCKRCTDGCPACDATKLQKESHDLL